MLLCNVRQLFIIEMTYVAQVLTNLPIFFQDRFIANAIDFPLITSLIVVDSIKNDSCQFLVKIVKKDDERNKK